MKFKFKNALLAFAALAMVGGVGTGVALGHAGEAVETKAAVFDGTASATFTSSSVTGDTVTEDDEIFKCTFAKNAGTTNPAWNTTDNGVRLYPKGTLTVSKNIDNDIDYTITGVTINWKPNKNNKGTFPTGVSINGSGTVTTDYSTSGTSYVVTGLNLSSFVITVNGTAGNIAFKSITISYSYESDDSVIYHVTYDGNGATTGSTSDITDYEENQSVTVLDCGYTWEFREFANWNTKADGSGTPYDPADTFPITKNTTLYAQWNYPNTNLGDGSYTASLTYSNPMPDALNVKLNETTMGLVSMSTVNVSYKDSYSEYCLAKTSAGAGKIVFTNHTNAKFTKIVLEAYMYDNCSVMGDDVTAHEGTGDPGDNHCFIEVDLDAQNTVTIENIKDFDANLFGATLYMKVGDETIHAASVSLNAEAGDVFVGKTRQLTANVLPTDADDRTVTWTSSDEDVATVDATGLVTGVAEGSATITATTNDGGFEAEFAANVKALSYGTLLAPLTTEEAFEVLQIAGETVTAEQMFVRGLVSSSSYGGSYTIWLANSDGSIPQYFELYHAIIDESIKGLFTASNSLVGVVVTATGYGKMYGNTPELFDQNDVKPVVKSMVFDAYTFAKRVLVETNEFCEEYVDESTYADRKDTLAGVWESLEEKYGTLTAEHITTIVTAEANESGTLIEQAMARYDYITGKYELNNFITGRTPVSLGRVPFNASSTEPGPMITTLVVLIAVSALATAGFVFARKKQRN